MHRWKMKTLLEIGSKKAVMIVTVSVGGLQTTPSVSTPAAQDAAERVFDEALGAIGMDPVQRGLARGMVRQQAGNIRRAAAC